MSLDADISCHGEKKLHRFATVYSKKISVRIYSYADLYFKADVLLH